MRRESMPAVSLQNIQISVSQDLIYQELDGEMVLLDMKSGQYFGLDSIGCRIWHMLQQQVHPQQMVETLTNEYEVEPEACEQQILTFIEQLQQNNLIS